MIYVTSDLHGYPLSDFQKLLEKARFSDVDDLIVLGDVIDRNNDGGIEMLRWMLQQVNVRMILGNHEAMMLSCRFLFDTITDESLAQFDQEKMGLLSTWMMNGAGPTMKSMRDLFYENAEIVYEIIDYLENAPLYEVVETAGRRFLLTHSGLGHFAPDKLLSAYSPNDFLWNRPKLTDNYYQRTTTIFGHTPTDYYGMEYAGKMIRRSTWIDIDTGAANGGCPMLLRLEDEKALYVD